MQCLPHRDLKHSHYSRILLALNLHTAHAKDTGLLTSAATLYYKHTAYDICAD